ncbi:MAG: N-acetylmuramoyl-L-alanine amidase [Bacillota bacterium]|nr:N-acetylmuramoyl-L-alanine amidase [Bacillota bacterium]
MDIKKDFIPVGRFNRPGYTINPTYITIHDTGNASVGANAQMHAGFIKNAEVSWHFTVDDKEVIQHLPVTEAGYHTGTLKGNFNSIGIEICINADGDFEKAVEKTQELVVYLMREHSIPIERVVQHYDWSGKDCPRRIRHSAEGWNGFIDGVRRKLNNSKRDDEVSSWAADAQRWVIESGISDGKNPKGAVTREQVWTMLYRMSKMG